MEKKKTALEEVLSGEETRIDNENLLPNVTPLLNDLDPRWDVKNEKPWHRTLAYLLLEGNTVKDAAAAVKKSVEHCRAVRLQPWFKELTAQLAQQHHDNDFLGLLEGGALESITVLTDLATGAKSEATQRAAASELLRSYLNTKPEPTGEAPVEDPKAELKRLQAEIDQLKKQT